MPITSEELERRFTYHPPAAGQPQIYEMIREKARELASFIVWNTPESREQSLAITAIEEAVFWANAAIARNGQKAATDPNTLYPDVLTTDQAQKIDGNTSDGYHTFNELYDHRHALFICLMKAYPELSWYSRKHPDGTEWDGWFLAGMHLPQGDISYHLPDSWMILMPDLPYLEKAPEFDGHTSEDVVSRLRAFSWRSKGQASAQPEANTIHQWIVRACGHDEEIELRAAESPADIQRVIVECAKACKQPCTRCQARATDSPTLAELEQKLDFHPSPPIILKEGEDAHDWDTIKQHIQGMRHPSIAAETSPLPDEGWKSSKPDPLKPAPTVKPDDGLEYVQNIVMRACQHTEPVYVRPADSPDPAIRREQYQRIAIQLKAACREKCTRCAEKEGHHAD